MMPDPGWIRSSFHPINLCSEHRTEGINSKEGIMETRPGNVYLCLGKKPAATKEIWQLEYSRLKNSAVYFSVTYQFQGKQSGPVCRAHESFRDAGSCHTFALLPDKVLSLFA